MTESEELQPQCAISDLANEASKRTKHKWYLHKKHKWNQNQNNSLKKRWILKKQGSK